MHQNHPNPETAAALRELLRQWHGLEHAVRACLARHGDAAPEPLAKELRRAFRSYYRAAGGPFVAEMVRLGLQRVDWPGIACQLLERSARQQIREENEAMATLLRERGRMRP